jgi:MFS family permease
VIQLAVRHSDLLKEIMHIRLTRLFSPGQPLPFYYGWVMLPLAMLMLMFTAPAQTYGVSVFTPYIRESLGFTPAQIAAIYMAGTLLASLPLVWIGGCMDRFGLRRTITVVVVCFMGACLLVAQARGVMTLLLGFFVLRLFGQGALTMLSSNTLAFWFHRRLGLATGLKSIGVAASIAFAPRLHYLLIQSYGWRVAYLIMGVLIGAVLLPLMALVFRNQPADVGQVLEGTDAPAQSTGTTVTLPEDTWTFAAVLRTVSFYIAAASFALWALVATAISFSAAAVFEHRGMPVDEAAAQVTILFSALGFALLISNVAAGVLADRVPSHIMLALTMLSLGLVGWVMAIPGSERHAHWIGATLGASQALMIATGGTIWVRYYGRAHLGRIRGAVMTWVVAASSMGPLILDGVAALVQAYEPVLIGLGVVPILFAVAAFFATRPHPPLHVSDLSCAQTAGTA